MVDEKFVFCLEGVPDVETYVATEVLKNLEHLAFNNRISSIYKSCDTIEGFEESLGALLYNDHNFKDYQIIYLAMPGQENNICLHNYYYSLEEIAELFEGKLKGKIIHFANEKILDLTPEEAQYFLDITGARAISGYGIKNHKVSSIHLDKIFFYLCDELDDLVEIVEELHEKNYALCKFLDFRLYY